MAYNIKNESASTSFTATKSSAVFSQSDIEQLAEGIEAPKIEDIDISCALSSDTLKIGETATMICEVKNEKEKILEAKYCFEACQTFQLEPKGKRSFVHKYFFDKSGSFDLIFRVEEDGKIKKSVLNLNVIDKPAIKITEFSTTTVTGYGENFKITFKIEKDSFAVPKNVKLLVELGTAEVDFDVSSLDIVQEFVVDANTKSFLRKEEKIKVKLTYKDELGKSYTQTEEYPIALTKVSFWERIKMFFARIFG